MPKDADEKTKKAKSRRRDEALAKLKKGKYKIEKLIADLNKTDSKKKEAAIKILGDIGPDAHQAVSDLCRIMKEGDANAEAALIQIGKPAVPALIEMLSDENPQARKQAAFILGQIGPEAKEAIPALRKALDDTDIDVKSAAFSALDEIGWE